MREIMGILVVMMCVLVYPAQANTQHAIDPETVIEQDTLSLPKVFLLGDHESQFEKLSADYQTSLLTAYEDNFEAAFNSWMSMLKEMEAHSETVNYDLKGIKMWLNVFWDKQGKIQHIAFFLKPNSRNVDRSELGAFLTDFMNTYNFPLMHDANFSHSSAAHFPTLTLKKKQ